MSAHLSARARRRDVDAVVEQAKRYADAGLDLGIVYLPTAAHPDVLDELAAALSRPLKRLLRTPALRASSPRLLRSTHVGQIG